jgi:anti-sigma regulatory factor (Ser/Thr protein kinase)
MEAGEVRKRPMPLVTKAGGQHGDVVVRIPINHDCDIVTARQAARQLAAQAGVTGIDLTLLATAVSEVARNIVRFTAGGELVVEVVHQGDRTGVKVTARDVGPGIPDVDRAMADGFTTCAGLGLGLPGARRLMDGFAVVSDAKRGTTVTMTKWSGKGRE